MIRIGVVLACWMAPVIFGAGGGAPNRSYKSDRLCGEEWLAEALDVKCQGCRALKYRGSTAKFSLSDGLGFVCT